MRWNMVGIAAATALFGAIAATSGANAAVIIEEGPGNFPGDSNVVFNPCGANAVFGPALTVTGCLNDDHNYLVDFTSDQNLVANGGQARVEAESGTFDFLRVSTQPGSFATFITNIQADDGQGGRPNSGSVEITAFINNIAQTAQVFDLDENGQNFFRISTDNGDLFTAIEFRAIDFQIASVEFDDFRQNRVGPAPGTPVSEPALLGLLGLGLVGIAAARRRA